MAQAKVASRRFGAYEISVWESATKTGFSVYLSHELTGQMMEKHTSVDYLRAIEIADTIYETLRATS